MIVWEALQQFIDNSDDVEEHEMPGITAKVAIAQQAVDELTARFVAETS